MIQDIKEESNIIIRQASVSDAKVLATLRYNLRSSLGVL